MSHSDLLSMIQNGRLRFKTATSFVADTLRAAVLDGTLAGGTPLKQDELASSFQVSRMPIREALRQLEAEGLIDFQPHKGAVVTTLSSEDVGEIYEMRIMAETFALHLSVPHLSDSSLQQATSILDDLDLEEDPSRWGMLNRQFHATLYSGVERKRLHVLIESLNDAVDRYLRFLLTALDYQDRSQEEHRAILAACRAKEVNRAGELLTVHLEQGRQTMVDFLSRKSLRQYK